MPEPAQAPDLAGDSAVVGVGLGEGVEATGLGLGEGATDATGVAGGAGVGLGEGVDATGIELGEGGADATDVAGGAGAGADGPRMMKMPTPTAAMQASVTSPAINPTFRDAPTCPSRTGCGAGIVGTAAASV
jgi:hypothetical protein